MDTDNQSRELARIASDAEAASDLLQRITSSGSDLLLQESTVQSTLARYEGDELGAVMALDVTSALSDELPLSGILDPEEESTVDGLVSDLQLAGLSGLEIRQIAEYLNISFDSGALHALLRIRALLDSTDEEDMLIVDSIRRELLSDELSEAAEEAIAKEFIEARVSEDTDEDQPVMVPLDAAEDEKPEPITDETGEEFDI